MMTAVLTIGEDRAAIIAQGVYFMQIVSMDSHLRSTLAVVEDEQGSNRRRDSGVRLAVRGGHADGQDGSREWIKRG